MNSVSAGLNSDSPSSPIRIDALREELLAQLELLSSATSGTARLGDPGIEYVLELGPENLEQCEEVVVSGFSRTRRSADQPPLKLRRSAGASAKAEGGHCDG